MSGCRHYELTAPGKKLKLYLSFSLRFFCPPFGPGMFFPSEPEPLFPGFLLPPEGGLGFLGLVPLGPAMGAPPRCCRLLRLGCWRWPVRGSSVAAGVSFFGSTHLPLRRIRSSYALAASVPGAGILRIMKNCWHIAQTLEVSQ